MTFRDAVETCFRKYTTFSGRAGRPELWWFALFMFIGSFLLGLLDSALLPQDTRVFAPLFSLVTLLPALSVGARRLHDTGRSAWWLLLVLIPLLGFLLLLFFYILPGEDGANKHGPPPAR